MAWNQPQLPTRTSRRQERNALSRVLNWAIGIVIVAILVVGGYLVYSIMHHPASGKTASTTTSGKSASIVKKNAGTSSTASATGHSASQGNTAAASTTDSSAGTTSSTNTSSTSNAGGSVGTSGDAYHFVGGGPSGPWQPIGTIQSGPHTTNYKEGSVDWTERIKALLYATNINDNDYILWRLENGGGLQKSRGIISTKEEPNKKYVVLLQWMTNQGWEPTSVTLETASGSSSSSSGAPASASNASSSSNSSANGSNASNSSNSSSTGSTTTN